MTHPALALESNDTILLVENNKIIGEGKTYSSSGDDVKVIFHTGDIVEKIKETKTFKKLKDIPFRHLPFTFDRHSGVFLNGPFTDAEDLKELFVDTRAVTQTRLRYGMVPDIYKHVEGYRSAFRVKYRDESLNEKMDLGNGMFAIRVDERDTYYGTAFLVRGTGKRAILVSIGNFGSLAFDVDYEDTLRKAAAYAIRKGYKRVHVAQDYMTGNIGNIYNSYQWKKERHNENRVFGDWIDIYVLNKPGERNKQVGSGWVT